MKKTLSPLVAIGLLIGVAHIVIKRFITPIPEWLAIPLLVVAIVLMIVGGLKDIKKNKMGRE